MENEQDSKPPAIPPLPPEQCSAAALAELVKAVTKLLTEVRQMRDGLLRPRRAIAPDSDTLHWEGVSPADLEPSEGEKYLAKAWTKVIEPVEKALDGVKPPNDQAEPRGK